MPVNGMLMSSITMHLLAEDMADCVQIETEDGYLVKVLPPEQDFGLYPQDLRDVMDSARTRNADWLCISKDRFDPEIEHQYLQ